MWREKVVTFHIAPRSSGLVAATAAPLAHPRSAAPRLVLTPGSGAACPGGAVRVLPMLGN